MGKERTALEVLRANLHELEQATPKGERMGEVRLAKKLGIGVGTLRRAYGAENEKEGEVRLSALDALAGHYRVTPWQLLHPEGAQADASAPFTPEVLEIARQLDDLQDDPKRRKWALDVCEVVAFSDMPTTQEQKVAFLAKLLQAAQAT